MFAEVTRVRHRVAASLGLAPGIAAVLAIGFGLLLPRIDAMLQALSIEAERTVEQDPGFGFRQLVDIAVRALSPGVNDPTTAVQAVDQLHDLIRSLTIRCFPSQSRVDDGYPRVVIRTPSYEEYVRLAFEEIASYAAESVQVKRRLRLAFADCIFVASAERRAVLEAQRDRLSLD